MSEHPPNYSVYTEYTVIRTLQSFYTFVYFTRGLSDSGVCPFLLWTFGSGSPLDMDYGGLVVGWSVDMAAQDLHHERCSCRPVRD
jgi:hypothetical protein